MPSILDVALSYTSCNCMLIQLIQENMIGRDEIISLSYIKCKESQTCF